MYDDVFNLFRKKVLALDVVFIHVSPPDAHGYCSLGVSVEATLAAIENAKTLKGNDMGYEELDEHYKYLNQDKIKSYEDSYQKVLGDHERNI